MKLLYTKRSPYARKVRVLALEKKIHLDLIEEDLANKSKQLQDNNPLGKVPTLILDNGEVIYDSKVICQYLDEQAAPKFIPASGKARLEVLKWEAMADDLATGAVYTYMEKIRHPKDFHAQFVSNGENNVIKAYNYIEAHLAELKEIDLASVAVAAAIGYVQFRLPHIQMPAKLAEWYAKMNQRPSMAQTIPVG